MSNPVILCADSTCDLSPELLEANGVRLYPFHVILEEATYQDGIDLTPDDIVRTYEEKKVLPHTAAINVQEYVDFFRPFIEQGYDIVHISLGSGISSSHQNCRLAAEEFEGRVFPIDSCNLSTGSGLLVLEAAERIKNGMSAAQVADEVRALTNKVSASFVIDTLEFLHKGGRCSALAMFGANLLRLKPSIRVDNTNGTMSVGKKYRGSLAKCLEEYVREELEGRDDIRLDKVFVTHSPMDASYVEQVKELVRKYQPFETVYETSAGCTVTAHCGPNTLGVLFLTK
ncbi:MAG: DegV family protein [Clostridia bacterium]|nr:DegV family protein [Clostridia bacterium]